VPVVWDESEEEMNGAILTNSSARDRSKTDFYPTPPDVTEALLNFLEERWLLNKGDLIWEPACGTGDMAQVMARQGYAVTVSDLYPAGYSQGAVDFLLTDRQCD
jgi:2-polyprenyl-3-methyl-5-hydroxy-6-metoxy-1,4-benzoquinol methylase